MLDDERDAAWMQAVAAEMNLSETAFVRRLADGFELRWFTPKIEVDLCGHATLASAHALWTTAAAPPAKPIRFHTKSGVLTATQAGDLIELDFPATPAIACERLADCSTPSERRRTSLAEQSSTCSCCWPTPRRCGRSHPDFRRLAAVPVRGVIVTAASDDSHYDFISRFFAPAAGIDEDPVTGSAHRALGPFWSERLGKPRVVGYQASSRGGVVHVHARGERVTLGGRAVTVARGELSIAAAASSCDARTRRGA